MRCWHPRAENVIKDVINYNPDEIILMRAGKVVQRGSIFELLSNPKDDFVTAFIKAQRTLAEDSQEL